jgi:catechol 2,3-dioxygenase-like lactoylglutathione lyase family enzyme
MTTIIASHGVSHFELTVRDLARSLRFYRDLLGLRVVQEGATDRAFPNAARLRIYEQAPREFSFAVLDCSPKPVPFGLSATPTIVLLSPLGEPPSGASIKVDQIGITHFGLWVHGLDAVVKHLERHEVPCLEPPHTMVTTREGTVRSAFAQDPDGVIVQLDEFIAHPAPDGG